MVKANIDKKFSAHYDAVEQELKSSTVGKLLWSNKSASYNLLIWKSCVRTSLCFFFSVQRSGDTQRHEGKTRGLS